MEYFFNKVPGYPAVLLTKRVWQFCETCQNKFFQNLRVLLLLILTMHASIHCIQASAIWDLVTFTEEILNGKCSVCTKKNTRNLSRVTIKMGDNYCRKKKSPFFNRGCAIALLQQLEIFSNH